MAAAASTMSVADRMRDASTITSDSRDSSATREVDNNTTSPSNNTPHQFFWMIILLKCVSCPSMVDGIEFKVAPYHVKPCFQYNEEYKDCKSFKARFHQYFIHGETIDCSQWKVDYDNCSRWDDKEDHEALKKVVESEKARIRERLRGHLNNDVWEPRKEPPSDWSNELPSEIAKEYENSFLKKKAEELKEGLDTLGDVDRNNRESKVFDFETGSVCSIV